MITYEFFLFVLGAGLILASWIPKGFKGLLLSLPFVGLLTGYVAFSLPLPLQQINPFADMLLSERVTEFIVIVSLMSAGLKVERRFLFRHWKPTWLLLGITMPLSILLIALSGRWIAGLAPASAVLLGAVLAPTDPVLASDVQSGPPNKTPEGTVHFSLTTEAGFNDGLAFPFVNMAIAMVLLGSHPGHWGWEWFLEDFLYKIVVGIGVGWTCGKLVGLWLFTGKNRPTRILDGIVALACTLFFYGLAQILHGYGFLAVFVGAYTMRSVEKRHTYHSELHDLIDIIERFMTVVVLVLIGGYLVFARTLSDPNWTALLLALLVVFVIRPLAGGAAALGIKASRGEKAFISFYGIRGIGSLYYISYGLNHADFPAKEFLLECVVWTIVVSIVVHSLSAELMMKKLYGEKKLG